MFSVGNVATGQEHQQVISFLQQYSLRYGSPKKSSKELSQEKGFSPIFLYQFIKEHKLHPYKIEFLQELHGDDINNIWSSTCGYWTNYMSYILSCSLMFYLGGEVNRHKNNLQWIHVVSRMLNGWVALLGDQLIGPHIFKTM